MGFVFDGHDRRPPRQNEVKKPSTIYEALLWSPAKQVGPRTRWAATLSLIATWVAM